MNFAFSAQLIFPRTNERDIGFLGDKHSCELGYWARNVPHHGFWVRLGQRGCVSFQILTRISIFCWIPETPQGKCPSCRECVSSEIPSVQRWLSVVLALLLCLQNQCNVKQSNWATVRLSLFSWMHNALGLMVRYALFPITRIKWRLGLQKNVTWAICVQTGYRGSVWA